MLYSLHNIHLGLQPSLSTIHPIEVCGTRQCYGNHMSDVKYNTLAASVGDVAVQVVYMSQLQGALESRYIMSAKQ